MTDNNPIEGIFKDNQISKKNNLKFNPNKISYLNELTVDSYSAHCSENKFSVFKSNNNIFYLVYSTKNKSIIFHDLINNKKISEIKNAHCKNISYLLHFFDEINKKEYILSCSYEDNNLKLQDLYNLENLLCLININSQGGLRSASILKDNGENFIITSNCQYLFEEISEPLKVYDFKGNKVKEIENSNETTFFIEIFYDNKSFINYIITANFGCARSYIFSQNKLYHKYDNNTKKENHSVKIDNSEEIIKLIVASGDGYIRIWDFHSGILIKAINCDNFLDCLCLWNNEYAFVGCDNKLIKLVNLKSGNIVKELTGQNHYLMDIKKIVHPKYGECLISQGYHDDQIKLWVITN